MPVKKQLEVMLADAPGELAKLTAILKADASRPEHPGANETFWLLSGADWRRVARRLLRSNIKESAKTR
jgi:hypothetical protein